MEIETEKREEKKEEREESKEEREREQDEREGRRWRYERIQIEEEDREKTSGEGGWSDKEWRWRRR